MKSLDLNYLQIVYNLLHSEASHEDIILVQAVRVLDLKVALMQGGDTNPGVFQQILLDGHVQK